MGIVSRAEMREADRLFPDQIPQNLWHDLGRLEDRPWTLFESKWYAKLQRPGGVWAYLTQCSEIRRSGALPTDKAIRLAETGLRLARDLNRKWGRDRLRCQVRGLIVIGEIYRTLGELHWVTAAHHVAWRLLAQANMPALDFIHLYLTRTMALVDLRDLDQARKYNDRATHIAKTDSPDFWHPRSLAVSGYVSIAKEKPDLSILRQAHQGMAEDDKEYYASVASNLALVLDATGGGTPNEIISLIRKAANLIGSNNCMQLAKLNWIQARAYRRNGDFLQAEFKYTKSGEALMNIGSGYCAAMVSLDLAAMFVECGRIKKAKDLTKTILRITDMLPDVESQRALRLFVEASTRDGLNQGVLDSIRGTLEKTSRSDRPQGRSCSRDR